MIKVLLVCGGGASTGFVAKNMRTAATKINQEIDIIARPISSLEELLDSVDVVLIAPHFKFRASEIEQECNAKGKKAALANPEAYGMMDGDGLLSQVLFMMEDNNE